jgi:hypothetical protein
MYPGKFVFSPDTTSGASGANSLGSSGKHLGRLATLAPTYSRTKGKSRYRLIACLYRQVPVLLKKDRKQKRVLKDVFKHSSSTALLCILVD